MRLGNPSSILLGGFLFLFRIFAAAPRNLFVVTAPPRLAYCSPRARCFLRAEHTCGCLWVYPATISLNKNCSEILKGRLLGHLPRHVWRLATATCRVRQARKRSAQSLHSQPRSSLLLGCSTPYSQFVGAKPPLNFAAFSEIGLRQFVGCAR